MRLADQALFLPNPITQTESQASPVVGGLFISIIQSTLVLIAIVAVGMILYGGFQWMTARGESERLTQAKQTLFWAVAGLIVVGTGYAVLHFVIVQFVAIFKTHQ